MGHWVWLFYFGARYYDPEIALWTSTDSKHQFWSPYAYGSNPINGIDPDGNEFFFGIEPNGAGGNGHMFAVFTDGSGKFYRFDQGSVGNVNNRSKLVSGMDGGISVKNIGGDMSSWLQDPNMIFISTTADQDKLIYSKALLMQSAYAKGKEKYALFTNNCTDAVQEVAGAGGIKTPIDIDPRPNSFFSSLKNWFSQTFSTSDGGIDATAVQGNY